MKTAIVIFGATGDLSSRKLIPALFKNFRKRRLPEPMSIIGFASSPLTDEAFRQKMREAILTFAQEDFHEEDWGRFAPMLSYQSGDFAQSGDYQALAKRLRDDIEPPQNCLFYLAAAPAFFLAVVAQLHAAKLLAEANQNCSRRIIVEKPFGRDLQSAEALNKELHKILKEEQIYRIDHYLGKETVQNVIVFRFGNAIFEPLWNRNYVDHVQITVAETVGVEHRARYYEKAGVLRDMFQNHVMQLLTLVAMEPPAVYEADALRNEKVKVLTALREIAPETSSRFTVRAQYSGYREEGGVDPNSTTETFAALKCFVDNWRWQGVPFYLRSGKMLKEKSSEIVVQFRRPPTQILDIQAGRTELFTNRLSICIQPDEGLHLRFIAKVPDQGLQTRPVNMDFHFRDSFDEKSVPEAYERLLLDAFNGDASLFARSDEIEHSWRFIDTIRTGWRESSAPPLLMYAQRTWGPAAADSLLGRDGRWWMHDCKKHSGKDVEGEK
jgi:glucose-6-phosphate 1-dehydrogenase